jgi:hypothetical protein
LNEVRRFNFEQESEFMVTVSIETVRPEWPHGLDGHLRLYRLSIVEADLAIS